MYLDFSIPNSLSLYLCLSLSNFSVLDVYLTYLLFINIYIDTNNNGCCHCFIDLVIKLMKCVAGKAEHIKKLRPSLYTQKLSKISFHVKIVYCLNILYTRKLRHESKIIFCKSHILGLNYNLILIKICERMINT